MDNVLLALAVLACPIGMGAMMLMMMRPGHKGTEGSREQEIKQMRAEIDRLKAQQAQDRIGPRL
jgi:hypothetical protein